MGKPDSPSGIHPRPGSFPRSLSSLEEPQWKSRARRLNQQSGQIPQVPAHRLPLLPPHSESTGPSMHRTTPTPSFSSYPFLSENQSELILGLQIVQEKEEAALWYHPCPVTYGANPTPWHQEAPEAVKVAVSFWIPGRR